MENKNQAEKTAAEKLIELEERKQELIREERFKE